MQHLPHNSQKCYWGRPSNPAQRLSSLPATGDQMKHFPSSPAFLLGLILNESACLRSHHAVFTPNAAEGRNSRSKQPGVSFPGNLPKRTPSGRAFSMSPLASHHACGPSSVAVSKLFSVRGERTAHAQPGVSYPWVLRQKQGKKGKEKAVEGFKQRPVGDGGSCPGGWLWLGCPRGDGPGSRRRW